MSFRRIFPIASVFAVGAVAFGLRTATATSIARGDRRGHQHAASAIQNGALKDLLTKVAPTFVAHRDAARRMPEQRPR